MPLMSGLFMHSYVATQSMLPSPARQHGSELTPHIPLMIR